MKSQNTFSITGGLGNQLFQLAAALSIHTEGKFYIETDLGVPRRNSAGEPEVLSYILPGQVEIFERRKFRWITSKAVGYRLRMGIYPRNYEKINAIRKMLTFASDFILSVQMGKFFRIVPAQGLGFNELSLEGSNNFTIGYFQSYKWASQPKVLNQLRNLELKRNEPELDFYKQLALKECPLVVHVRLGDYKNQPSFGIPGRTYYEDAIRNLWATGNFNRIWVFSDEPDLAVQKLPSELSEYFRWVDEVAESTSATLEVMRLGSGYVIANSSFSWWGAFLSRNPRATVICPTPWFVGESSPRDLVPPEWTQMPISIGL